MKGERLTEELARGLAAPTRRRTVLAALVVGLLVPAGTGEGPVLAAAADRRRRVRNPRCRRNWQCEYGEACVRGRCKAITGFAPYNVDCRTTADCSTKLGPAVCEVGLNCICEIATPGSPIGCDSMPHLRCRGTYVAATEEAASCTRDCDCAAGLTCQGGGCRPAPAS